MDIHVSHLLYFNPRSREGSDDSDCKILLHAADFNPRSREGSDSLRWQTSLKEDNFNPRSREGSDSVSAVCGTSLKISIRAPARGATSVRI